MNPFRFVLMLAILVLTAACASQPVESPSTEVVYECQDKIPGEGSSCNPIVTIEFGAGGIISGVSDDAIGVCKNGKITFKTNDPNYKDYGIFISRDPDNKTKKPGYWSNLTTGETEVKVKDKKGCVGYTVIRKLNDGSGLIEYLDPVFIIDK